MTAATAVPWDRELCVVATASVPLRWATPPSVALPPIVRAGSALRRWRDRWIVVQDDVRALAAADDAGHAVAWPMPASARGERAFDDLRGNKRAKPDLESAVVLPDGRLLALGSGAKAERECIAVVDVPGRVALRPAAAFYAPLRAALGGATPNLEGAIVVDGALRLFQRATGVAVAGAPNATLDVALDAFVAWLDGRGPVPRPHAVRWWDLGAHDGVALGFTDAAVAPDGRVAFLACAEATDDPVADGAVVAQRFGWLDGARPRQGTVVDAAGRPLAAKLEGLEPVPGEPGAWQAVTDADDPAAAALLVRLETRP